jgi:hypothetical protein
MKGKLGPRDYRKVELASPLKCTKAVQVLGVSPAFEVALLPGNIWLGCAARTTNAPQRRPGPNAGARLCSFPGLDSPQTLGCSLCLSFG